MHTDLAPAPLKAQHDGRTPTRAPLPGPIPRFLHALLSTWQALRYWVSATTGVPTWLPARWRRPLAGYLLALLITGVAGSITFLLSALVPAFEQEGVLLLVGIVVIALICGVGPSLLATAVNILLIAGALLAASFTGQQHSVDWLDVAVLLVSGLGLSLLAGQSRWARRKAEALAGSLCRAKASSDVERLRLRALLEALPAPVSMVNARGEVIEANAAARTLMGDTAPFTHEIDDFARIKGWWFTSGQPLGPDSWAIARALYEGERVSDEEVEIETLDGRRKIILVSATPVHDEHGASHGAVGVSQDITVRKRLEEALRQAEREAAEHAAQLEAIFESIADGVVVTDRESRVLHMNQAYRTLLGLEQDPTGRTFPELAALAGFTTTTSAGHPLSEVEAPVLRVLQGEVLTDRQSVDTILRTSAGRETLLNSTGAPIRDEMGQMLGSVLVARDMTERRQLEQQTRDSLDALLAMAEALVQGHEQGDPAPAEVAARLAELTRRVLNFRSVSIVAVDGATEALTPITVVGHTREDERRWWAEWERESNGQEQPHLRDVLPADAVAALHAGEPVLPDHVPASLCCQKKLPHPQACPSVVVPMRIGESLIGLLQVDGGAGMEGRATGETGGCEQKGALLQAVARLGALVLERERLLGERTQAQATELALRATQTQMEAFLATAAHDLRAPLAAVVGYLELAVRQTERLAADVRNGSPDLDPHVDAVRQRLDLAGEGTQRLTRLLNLLFDTAAIRAGRLELHREPGDLATLVHAQVEALRVASPERAIRLHVPAATSAPVLVEADADRIGQVVTNYVTNALKYSPSDQPVEVSVTAHASGSWARVAVHDRGPGLPETERMRVWEPFHRVSGVEVQSTTRGGVAGGSLGLGLHICKTIIQAHGGQVGVESMAGAGSTFWFTLPLAGEARKAS